MIEIRKPVENMTDFETIVKVITETVRDENINIISSAVDEDVAKITASVVHLYATTNQYSLSMHFIKNKVLIEEFPFGIIPKAVILYDDLKGVDVLGKNVVFYFMRGCGKKYGFKKDEFTIDFEDITKSTPELLDSKAVEAHCVPVIVKKVS